MTNGTYLYNPYNVRPINSINWVQGIDGARAYNLMPKESVVLMDNESDDMFYIKICDDIGRCTLRKFRYTEVTDETPTPVDMSEFVKKSELEALINSMLGGKNE